METGFYRLTTRRAPPARRCVLVAVGGFVTGLWASGATEACGAPETRVAETQRHMGVPWTIVLYAQDERQGARAVAAAYAEIARLERILSDYDPASELSQLSARAPTDAPVPVSDDLWRVLTRAVEIRDATDGAFDPTVGPLTSLWRQVRRTGRLPTADRLLTAREAVGPDALALAHGAQAVTLHRRRMRLDLGGIGMGYAVDRALEVIGSCGIESALVDASGDIGVSGPPPGSRGWRIDVAPLRAAGVTATAGIVAEISLAHGAVTTSGDAFQGIEIEGRRYSHIVDPRTGLGVVGPAAVTVLAGDCMTADAWATAASVLGPADAPPLLARQQGCEARFVWLENGHVRQQKTSGWPSQSSHVAE